MLLGVSCVYKQGYSHCNWLTVTAWHSRLIQHLWSFMYSSIVCVMSVYCVYVMVNGSVELNTVMLHWSICSVVSLVSCESNPGCGNMSVLKVCY